MMEAEAGDGVTVTADRLIALRHLLIEAQRDATVSALPGGFAIARRGNGQVIADSRLYIQGDDIRHVDRGATARTGELHVRTFHEERDRVCFLVADFRPCMLWGLRRALWSVAAAEALAWLGWQTIETGGRVGLLAVTGQDRIHVPSRGRVRGMLGVVGGLVRAHDIAMSETRQGMQSPPLDRVLSGLDRLVPRGSEMILASALDTCGDGFADLIGDLSRRRRTRIIRVGDRDLDRLPAGSYPVTGPDGVTTRIRYGGRVAAATTVQDKIDGCLFHELDAAVGLPQGLQDGTA